MAKRSRDMDPPRPPVSKLRFLDARPIVIAIAGSNGAGKSTFFHAHLADMGLRFVNTDDLALQLRLGTYEAAEVAAALRGAMIEKRESFIFETVLSDPIGEKIELLTGLAHQGYTVALIFIQIDDPATSIGRVSMRVAQGGHDVPDEKLRSRFGRTRTNLQRAIEQLPHVIIYDNSDFSHPYRLLAIYGNGTQV